MKAQSLFLVCVLFTNLLRAQEPAPLRISVIAGEGGREVSNQKIRVDPVVEVDDEDGKPIQGAAVVFSLPKQGPGGSFESGTKTLTVETDAQGHATVHGIRLNGVRGPFTIHVVASYQARTAAAIISETSIRGSRSGGAFGVSTRTWVIAGLVLIAIAGGIVAAKQLRSGPKGNVITATPGIPVVGGPQ